MLGFGGTPYASIKRFFRANGFVAGANAFNAKNGAVLNVPVPIFSVPIVFNNETYFGKFAVAIYNTGGQPSYCSHFSSWAVLFGSTPVNSPLTGITKLWEQSFSVNAGLSSVLGVCDWTYVANVASLRVNPTMSGSSPQSPNRIDAYLEIYNSSPQAGPITNL